MPDAAVRTRTIRQYSDAQRAEAMAVLASNDGNLDRTAGETGIPRKTLETWRNRDLSPPRKAALEELSVLATAKIRDVYEVARRKAVMVSIEKMHDLDAYRAGILSCALTDKCLVLDGQPNVIHGNAPAHPALSVLTDDELRALCAQPVTVVDTLACGSDGSQASAEIVHAEVQRSAETPGGIETGRPLIMQQPRETALAQAGAAGQLAQAQPALREETGERGAEREGG